MYERTDQFCVSGYLPSYGISDPDSFVKCPRDPPELVHFFDALNSTKIGVPTQVDSRRNSEVVL